MNSIINDRKFVGRLIYSVLTERKNVREAILAFPNTEDKSIECAYHALIHFEADAEMRARDIEYKEEQDEYLEFIAQTLSIGKEIPRNMIAAYEPFYKGTSRKWEEGVKGFVKEFFKAINIS